MSSALIFERENVIFLVIMPSSSVAVMAMLPGIALTSIAEESATILILDPSRANLDILLIGIILRE
jgi:hypothetical protein